MTERPARDTPETTDHLLDEFEAERPGRDLEGFPAKLVAVLGAGLALFAILWVFRPLAPQVYRPAFLTVALLLTFIVFGRTKRPSVSDWVVAGLSVAAIGYAVVVSDELIRRAAQPTTLDIVFGTGAILVVLEATRRTTGWALPAICIAFLFYAFFGGLIPDVLQIGHKGYGIDRIVGQSYMGLEGIFGIPLDVAATYIVLFAIYGAVLEFSGAARFFVEISFAAFGRSRTGPGRTSALAGFLLGSVSGSGVATTVTLGSVAWPLLRKAGYPKDEGGGIMAASGIGAILEPADARRRGVHHRRDPGGQLPPGAGLRDRPVGPVLHRDPAGDRGRRAPPSGQGPRPRDPGVPSCSSAGATTSRACS